MLDKIIFIGFLFICVIAGLYSSRGVRGLKEYAIGNKNFSTATIAITLASTYLSGSGFAMDLNETYNQGLYYIWPIAAAVIVVYSSTAYIFAPLMKEFTGKLSIADAMGDLFGKEVRIITASAGFLYSAGLVSMQLKVAGVLCEYGLGISQLEGILVIGLIITAYASYGGIKSVNFTDVIQFFTFITIIPIIIFIIIQSMENTNQILDTLQHNELFNYKEVFNFTKPKSLEYLLIFFIFALPGFSPAMFQRIAIAKDLKQIQRSHMIACVSSLLIILAVIWIGILILSKNPNLQGVNIFYYLVENYTGTGIKGLLLVSVMAMVMSTADSHINSTSVLFVHDFCIPLKINFVKNELLAIRLSAFLIGIFAIYFTIYNESLFKILRLMNSFYVPIVVVPFTLALFGFRPHKACIMAGMLAGLMTVILWEFVGKFGNIDGFLPGIIMNCLVIVISHNIFKMTGFLQQIKDDQNLKLAK